MDQLLNQVSCSIGQRCPIYNPQYKIVNGSCYYFETSVFSYTDAKANCHSKSGILFEPQSVTSNEAVFQQSRGVSNMTDEKWIGINR